VRQRRRNERVTAVVIPAQIRIVARRQSGTRTRPVFNRSSSRRVRALRSSQRRARVMPRSASDTAHDSGPPAIPTNTRSCAVLARARFRCHPAQPRMRAMPVKIALEIKELHLQISGPVQNTVRSRHSRRIVPIKRSTNGCDSGAYGTVLMAFTSRIRRFACHWWNRYSGSWSELR
jgi:hypothetical protein